MRAKKISVSQKAKKQCHVTIDVERQLAYAEAGVTMEQLVAATRLYGLIPKVVPEFRGITVGGAINGAAIESSSHRYGQFNDICRAYRVALGDRAPLLIDAESHEDLFYGMAGSYGSLGTLVQADIELIPSLHSVRLEIERVASLDELPLAFEKRRRADFLEAIMLASDQLVLISGYLSADPPPKPWGKTDDWFYSYISKLFHKLPVKGVLLDLMAVESYLFRHDRGAFWMGGYALNPALLWSYGLHKVCHGLQLPESDKVPYATPKNPGKFFCALWGWLMGSQRLYKSLHNGSEKWFEHHFVIQDFYIPFDQVVAFVQRSIEANGIFPLWFCPVRATTTPQLFSPHRTSQEQLLVDIGVYGMANQGQTGEQAVRFLEQEAYARGGKKMFYAYNYLPLTQFWQQYPQEAYYALRKAYGVEGYPSIEAKIF